jgi:RHS repeat-associated protein
MTTAAICASRELSWSPSFYRGEQYDSDLGLYYLRARYYNPQTGRFLSRDPEDGHINDPASLHKYLYANGDPVNALDPTGRDVFEYVALMFHSAYDVSEFGKKMSKCINDALQGEANLISDVVSGKATKNSGLKLANDLEKCGGEAIRDLMYGPALYITACVPFAACWRIG